MPKRKPSRVSTLLSTIWAGGWAIIKSVINFITKVIFEVASKETTKVPRKVIESPVCLVVLSPDENPDNDIIQSTPPFKLCHGAEHCLRVKAPEGSSWCEQPLSLLWMNNDSSPDDYGLSTTPPLHLDSGEEEGRYQKLSTAGAEWQLIAASNDALQSGDVTLGLGSYWHAPKYEIKASVGDFRYDITDLKWNGVIPIVEQGNSAILTATVTNPYDGSSAVEGVMVVWCLDGKEYERIPTDVNGQSKLSYTPTPEEVGDRYCIEFTATCVDGLKQSSQLTQSLPVFVKEPWPDQLTVEFLGWGAPLDPQPFHMRLIRDKSANKLFLTPKQDDSYFIGKRVTLSWVDESARLGIEFSPKEPQLMPKEGLGWTIDGGNESGVFNLKLTAAELDTPFLLAGVQVSGDLLDEATFDFEGSEEGTPPIFYRGVERGVRMRPRESSPLALMELTATLSFRSIDPGVFVQSAPDYDDPSEGIPQEGVEWRLTTTEHSKIGAFGLVVEVPGFTTALKQERALAISGKLEDEAELLIDGVLLGSKPLILRRKKTRTITLKPKQNSGLGRTSLEGWLTFESEGLGADKVIAVPDYTVRQAMTEEGLSWTLTGADVSCSLSLAFHVEGFLQPIVLAKVLLLSNSLKDEVALTYEETECARLIFRRDKQYILKCVPRDGSPLAKEQSGLTCSMKFTKETLDPLKMPAVPAYGQKRAMTEGGLDWTLTSSKDTSGWFGLSVEMEGFDHALDYPESLLLSEQLSDEAELEIALSATGVPPIFQVDVNKTVRIVPKAGSPLALAELAATLHFEPREEQLTAAHLTATPAYGTASPPLTNDGFTWTIKPNDARGEFGLRVNVSNFSTSLEMEKGYLMSSHLGNDVRVFIDDIETELGDKVLVLRRQKPHTIKMVPRDDKKTPLGRTGLNGWITFIPGSLEQANVGAAPNYGVQSTVTSEGLSWTLRSQDISGTCALDIMVEGFATPRKIETVRVLSEQLDGEVDVKLDGVDLDTPLILRREKPHKLTVVPKNGSPLKEMTGNCSMSFINGSLVEDQVDAKPPYNDERPMNPAGLEWTLTGEKVSGTFGLGLHYPDFPALILGNSVLLSSNLGDELELTVDGKPEKDKPISRRGQEVPVALRAKPGSPMSDSFGIVAKLEFFKSGALEKEQVTASPGYGVERTAPVNALMWKLKGPADKSGVFGVEVHAVGFTAPARWEKAIVLSELLSDEVTVTPDPLLFATSAKVTLAPASGSPIVEAGLDVWLINPGNGSTVHLRSAPGYGEKRTFSGSLEWVQTWEAGTGGFQLNFHVDWFQYPRAMYGRVQN